MTQIEDRAPKGYVLGASENGGNIFIKVGPAAGSINLPRAPNRCESAEGFRSTGTCEWTKHCTFWKAAEYSR
jgi:hypothetical protein